MRHLALQIGRSLALALLVFVLLLGAGFVWLTSTGAGAAWSLDQVNQQLGQRITIDGVEGTLFSPLSFEKLVITTGTSTTELHQGRLEWNPKSLLNRQLLIERIVSERVVVQLAPGDEPQAPASPPRLPAISIPIHLMIDQAKVPTLDIIRPDQTPLRLENLELSGQWRDHRVTLTGLSGSVADVSVFLEGDLELAEAGVADLSATLNQNDQAGSIRLQLQGPVDDFSWSMTSDLAVNDAPDYRLNAAGRGNLEGLRIERSRLDTLEGVIKSTGNVDWWPALQSQIRFTASGLNPADVVPELDGKLALEGEVGWQRDELSSRITGHGQLRDYPVELAALGGMKAGEVNLRAAQVVIGGNRIEATGKVSGSDHLALHFLVKADQLSDLYPGLQGGVAGNGKLSGRFKAPTIQTRLRAAQLRWQDQNIEQLSLHIEPVQDANHAVNIEASGLSRGDTRIERIRLDGEASPRQQDLTLVINAEHQRQLHTRIRSSIEDNNSRITGDIRQTKLVLGDGMTLSQTADAGFQLSKQRQQLDPLCLGHSGKNVCLNAEINLADQSRFQLNSDRIPLSAFSRWVPETGKLEDTLGISLDARGDGNDWQIESLVDLDSSNQMKVSIGLDGDNKMLSGNGQLRFDKIQWLALFSTAIAPPEGRVQGQFSLSGSLDQPSVEGRLTLREGLLRLPATGTELSNITLDVELPAVGDRADIKGELKTGDGTLTLAGAAHWRDPKNPELTLNGKGSDLLVMDTHEAKVFVSPDLTLDVNQKQIELRGSMALPEARFTPGEVPATAARVSADEVIVTAKGNKTATTGLPLRANIDLTIGGDSQRNVVFDGFGLHSELSGRVNLTQRPGKPAQGDGSVRIVEGYYKAYGQDLKIERGEIFFNGPLDNPGYSIQAVRNSGDIRAGIRLSGTLEQPTSTLFSDPQLSETDTLSYLLTGQAFNREGAGNQEADALLLMAATRWGLKTGGGILENLQAKTGFDTLEISAADDLNESALLVGKYLTPSLYLQYAMRLFEETDILSLRYQLGPHWQLEAESGSSQGLDLIYQIERD